VEANAGFTIKNGNLTCFNLQEVVFKMKRSNQFQNLGLICSDFAWEIPVSLGLLPVYLGVFRLRLGHHRFLDCQNAKNCSWIVL
jgi:hypothetical protein